MKQAIYTEIRNSYGEGCFLTAYFSERTLEFLRNPEVWFVEKYVVVWYKNHRNKLAEVRVPDDTDRTVVLKSYGARYWSDRLRIRGRTSKAKKHWENAKMLRAADISTPRPLLMLLAHDPHNPDLLAVEPAAAHRPLREFIAPLFQSDESVELTSGDISPVDLVQACGQYIRSFHDSGFVHRDMSGGNILVLDTWDGTAASSKKNFVIVDINRVRKIEGDIGINLRIQDLERLNLPERYLQEFYRAYAGERMELQNAWPTFLKYRTAYRRIRSTRNPVWRLLLKLTTYWVRTG
ncbi:MAG: lipopolysaccharide kinase InaA family protein [Pseudomonadota bacterium]